MIPDNYSTLIEMLEYHAKVNGERVAFTFNGQATRFNELWQGINQFGAFLLDRGIGKAEPVVIALPNSSEFFSAFYGIQRAGGIAVPVFPGAGAERIFTLASLCMAHVIVVPSNLPTSLLTKYRDSAAMRDLSIVMVAESDGVKVPSAFPTIHPEDISFLQYTSGSTGNPKGVMLSHVNLLTNIRQMIAGMEITKDDIFVSWLPVYHDMGLILKTMVPFFLTAQTHLLPTDLRNVHPWPETIVRRRATFTAAPDFAYRLLLRHSSPGAYDLSSLRVALNAAEPVRANTIHDFESKFNLQNVMVAGYGLAEATVGVSMWKPSTCSRVDRHGHVSVGKTFPGVEVLVWGDGKILPSGEIGEIMIRSQANSRGYYQNTAETKRLFWKDGYLRSGDLGYLDSDGFLYIVSRKKNIIKRSGETISPQEIEEVIDNIPGIRFSVALGLDRGDIEGEQVYVFAEVRGGESLSEEALYELALTMVEKFTSHMGFHPGRVYLMRPRTIPLTYNGKIQHGRLKEMYLNGDLRKQGAILYPDY